MTEVQTPNGQGQPTPEAPQPTPNTPNAPFPPAPSLVPPGKAPQPPAVDDPEDDDDAEDDVDDESKPTQELEQRVAKLEAQLNRVEDHLSTSPWSIAVRIAQTFWPKKESRVHRV